MADLRLSETSAALRTEFSFAPAAEPTAEPTADQPPDPPSPKRELPADRRPTPAVPTGPVVDGGGLAQQMRHRGGPARHGSLLDPEVRELAEGAGEATRKRSTPIQIELLNRFMQPLVAESARGAFFLHHRAIFKQRLVHDR